jgi:hypothetical protein
MTEPKVVAGSPRKSPFRFSFLVREHGWAEGDFLAPEGPTHLSASYLGDALGSLLRAVDGVLDGAESASATWREEPGHFRWAFIRRQSRLELRIFVQDGTAGLWFGPERDAATDRQNRGSRLDWSDEPPDSLLLNTSGSVREIALAVADGAQRVLTDLGEVNYWLRWTAQPFPLALLRSIQGKLDVPATGYAEDLANKFDPLLPEMIKRWSAYLRGELSEEEFGPWVRAELGTGWRDEIAHDGLQRMNDASLGYDGSSESKGQYWLAFRDWAKQLRRFADDPSEWNRAYYKDYFRRILDGARESSVPRFAQAFRGVLSENDIAEALETRPQQPSAEE